MELSHMKLPDYEKSWPIPLTRERRSFLNPNFKSQIVKKVGARHAIPGERSR
jgi:hypothetical protein